MRNFDYKKENERLLTSDIVALLTKINEYKGKQNQYIDIKKDTLDFLVEVAKVQSTEASNRIEGIYTSDERLRRIVAEKTTPRNRNEEEIAGYRDVLNTIHENYEYIPVTKNMILQLHQNLYKFSGMSIGGSFKNSDNVIAETDSEGNQRVRFNPVSAWETPEYVDAICEKYNDAVNNETADPLIASAVFILDFLCIHPFNDGNGRMSRLLTLLMLYRAGFMVGKYISIEKIIEKSKETYYEVLEESSEGWHEDNNNYEPFVKYLLGVIVAAYREFDERVLAVADVKQSKPDMVADLIKNTIGQITKREIAEQLGNISEVTIQRALASLLKEKKIIKIGGGRYTKYIWNRDN
ncbi:MAG: Fic family protein [Bacillus sp. (in: Bacteria)]|nr:Fic family protein [Bacillus sp. (in: firmicutes)]